MKYLEKSITAANSGSSQITGVQGKSVILVTEKKMVNPTSPHPYSRNLR